jgi:DNA polymerase III epsilon subunit-like protein
VTIKLSDAAKRQLELIALLGNMRMQMLPNHGAVVADYVFEKYTAAEVIDCGRRQGLAITRESGLFKLKLAPPREPMQDVMIDIETMATHPNNSLILSIGLLEFDPTGDKLALGNRTVIRPPIIEQLLMGRAVESGTQKFWAEQPKAAIDDWREGPRDDMAEVFSRIEAYTKDAKRVWAHGVVFDIGNVASLLRQSGYKEPWHYRAPRCARQHAEEHPTRRIDPLDESTLGSRDLPHTAVYDCIVQAHRVWQHWPKAEELMHHPV